MTGLNISAVNRYALAVQKAKHLLLQRLTVHLRSVGSPSPGSGVLNRGWPIRQNQLQPAVRLFFPYRDDMTVEEGIVMKGHTTVIPQSLPAQRVHQNSAQRTPRH
ncbi:hypothetical protein CesoFtcFv8_019476 [Champsocephalus esox]|uniref:Uncharacterized protein n=1 Tax=Champsocephalus esox TaxID=159716 RepID=A0AAN8BDY9_9TELE|nr:hypothetical protein CesoFtcFv8_019476 [Champsocephalus esox]